MTSPRVWLSRLLDIVQRRRRDERLAEEIQAHLDLLAADYVRQGLPPDEARRAARRAFGNVDRTRADYRDQRGLPQLEALAQDLRYAARLLHRAPGFAVTIVLVLALGIGVNNMLFAVLNAHTLRGLPIARAEQVVYITTADERSPDRGVSFLDFTDWQARATSFAGLAAFANSPVVLAGDGQAADRLDGTFVSANAFAVIARSPVLGRDFSAEDDRRGAPPVAILGYAAWQARYGGDPTIIGRAVHLNGRPAEIIGIMPDRSGFPSTAQVWLPLSQLPEIFTQSRGTRPLRVIGRLRDGSTVSDARAETTAIVDGLAAAHAETNKGTRAQLVTIDQQFFGSVTNPAWLAFIATGIIVVLISSANAANLMLARSLQRSREIAIRASLGATSGRIVRQLLIEGAVLAALGGTLGLGLAVIGVRTFRRAIPASALPYWVDHSPDLRVIAALIGVSAATVLVFALIPAIHASRPDVGGVLKDGGRAGSRRGARRWTTAFLAAEFGLAVVLLAHFVVNVRTSAPGIPSDVVLDTGRVLTATITLPSAAYGAPEQRRAFYARLDERLRALPGVTAASATTTLPLRGAEERRLAIDQRAREDQERQPTIRTVHVGPGYFETLGLTLTRGRGFTDEDGTPGRRHAVVNERLVEQIFGEANPLGRRIQVLNASGTEDAEWLTVIGVAPSVRQRLSPVPDALVYLPFRSAAPVTAHVLVRSDLDAAALTAQIRQEAQRIDGNLPLYRIATMAQVLREARWNGRLASQLFLFLTFIAVALSTAGLYAVTAYSVSQRAQEIGVRIALGAGRTHLVRLIARSVAVHVALGFLTGIACTKVWSWMFDSGRAEVTVTDPTTLAGVGLILVIVGTLACIVPIRRAIRLDPVVAIRAE